MLVLQRYPNESVHIDLRAVGLGMVKVLVIGLKGRQVILGFEADTRVPIHRSELLKGDGEKQGDQ